MSANSKIVRISILANGNVTLWKHELEVNVLNVVSEVTETWDWKEFVSRMGTSYIQNPNPFSNKVTFCPQKDHTTADLISDLRSALKDYFVDSVGDSHKSGYSSAIADILRPPSTKQNHVMFA